MKKIKLDKELLNRCDTLFVTYDIALKLKELGFNEECVGYFHSVEFSWVEDLTRGATTTNSQQNLYESDCTAPLWQQVIDWLLEKYSLILKLDVFYHKYEYSLNILMDSRGGIASVRHAISNDEDYYKSREQAIIKTLEFIKLNGLTQN